MHPHPNSTRSEHRASDIFGIFMISGFRVPVVLGGHRLIRNAMKRQQGLVEGYDRVSASGILLWRFTSWGLG